MKLIKYIYFILFLLGSVLIGQNNFIKSVKIQSVDNEITINPQLNNFLNDDIISAVNSGMNIAFHFYFELHDSKNNVLKEQESQINVRNDIWENQYILTGYNISKKFKEFENFKKYLLDSILFRLSSTKKINNSKKMQMVLTFSPQKITSLQKNKLKNWLKNEDQDSESTLSLNLTKLISFFLADKKTENISIYKSDYFTKKSVFTNESTPK